MERRTSDGASIPRYALGIVTDVVMESDAHFSACSNHE